MINPNERPYFEQFTGMDMDDPEDSEWVKLGAVSFFSEPDDVEWGEDELHQFTTCADCGIEFDEQFAPQSTVDPTLCEECDWRAQFDEDD